MKVYVNLDGLYSLYKKAKKGEKVDDYEIVREIEEAFMLAVDDFLASLGFEYAEAGGVYDGMWVRGLQIGEIEVGEIEIETEIPALADYIRDAIKSIAEILSQYNIKTIAYICSTLFWGYVVDFIHEDGTIVQRRVFNFNELLEQLWEVE